jgi:hypothetical protein
MTYADELATLCAPGLATLVHPGNGDDIQPFPLSLSMFQPAAMPEGMAREVAEEMGMPTPDLNRHFLEAVIHLFEMAGAVVRPAAEYADLQAAAGAQEGKRNAIKQFTTDCGQPAFRAMVRDFDSDNPRIPCGVIEALHGMSAQCPHGKASA